MPLVISVTRGFDQLSLFWDEFTLGCIYTAALIEGDPEFEYQPGKRIGSLPPGNWIDFSMSPIYYLATKAPLVKQGFQALKHDHSFHGEPVEGHIRTLELKAGDILRQHRER